MNNYLSVLTHIKNRPQTFQSDHFRGNAAMYAEAASRGHISCLQSGRNKGRWTLTAAGSVFLETYGNA